MVRHKRSRVRRGAAWLGVWLLALTAGATLPLGHFPPRHSTLVLFTGLPGDVESETSYHEQTQAWLEILVRGGLAERVIVLADAPESVKLPAALPGKVVQADRAHFLEVSRELGGQTNPLVMIAWGHGGRQGREPVFHVRGPRLRATDFVSLAAECTNRSSYWVLMFRESGSFARALAADRRWVLASENETAFTSDPVGMGILLRLAKGAPTEGFSGLCLALGRETEAWYTDRNLARTEEPTLRANGAKPQLLAAAATGAGAGKNPALPPMVAEALAGKGGASTNNATELPTAWASIKRADPRDFPEADGVTLLRRVSHTCGSNPALTVEMEEFIQILTAEGKRLADFDFSYAPPFEDITFTDCELLRADGKLVQLDPEAIREAGTDSGDYAVGRHKFFSLPGAGPGAILHVKYRTQWKTFPLPHVAMEAPIPLELPAVRTTIQVTVPREGAFHWAAEDLTASAPTVTQSTYGIEYTWGFDKLAARKTEILSPPGRHPKLVFSTFPDWRSFAEWYSRISQLTDQPTAELEAKAKELTQGASTPREKIQALYNYVTALRYVAVPMGVNSFRPHAAANVLQNQYGDCKDKANLLNALLHTLGIEARLVLVPRFSQARDEVPGLGFNHAISRVTLEGGPLWLDTTDDVCRFGLLPPGDPGRKVLVVDGHTDALTDLPTPPATQQKLTLRGVIHGDGPLDALPATLTAAANGYPDYQWRIAAREAKGNSLPLLTLNFRPVTGTYALDRQTATPVSALQTEFAWRAEGDAAGLMAESAGHRVLHPPFWVPKEWDLALHHRTGPLFLNQGYPLLLEEEFAVDHLAHATSANLPAPAENAQGPLRWRVEWAKVGDDKVGARLTAELAPGELSAEDSRRFQAQYRALLSAFAGGDARWNP